MKKLIEGLRHFMDSVHTSEQELFQRLAAQQSPEVMLITCADSRISPSKMTGAAPGELFILRNAGNIVPPYGAGEGGEAATVEYAVSVLNVRDIVVCGHSNCGVMKGLIDPESCSHLPAVSSWLQAAETTRRILSEVQEGLSPDALASRAAEINVLVQIANLRTHPAVAARLATGRLHLHGWLYDIGAGKVSAYDPAAGQFLPISNSSPAVTMTSVPLGTVV